MIAEPHVERVGPNRWALQATLAAPWGGAEAGRPIAIILDHIEAISFLDTGGAVLRLSDSFQSREVRVAEGWAELRQAQSLINRRPAVA